MIAIRCLNCGTKHEFNDDELVTKCVGSDTRQFGTEWAYVGEIEKTCTNINCAFVMWAQFNFWEYPSGELCYKELVYRRCRVILEPNYINYFKKRNN